MQGYFAQHAIDNVWCNPDQDAQYCIAGKRVTPDHGSIVKTQLFRRDITLPGTRSRYHVYNIGQIPPGLMSLLKKRLNWAVEKWVRVDDFINETSIYVELITKSGVQLPRSKAFYMFTNENSMIYALEIDKRFPIDYNLEEVFFRLYNNAFFQSDRRDGSNDFISTASRSVESIEDVVAFRAIYDSVASKPGFTTVWVNGETVSRLDTVTAPVGSYMELVHDTSFKRQVLFPIGSLEPFTSTLDNESKYLVHYAGPSDKTIDYVDDIDVEVSYELTGGRWKGRTYPKLVPMSLRMLTHRDYSLPVDFVTYIIDRIKETQSDAPSDYRSYTVRLKIRKSGYVRSLVHDNNRILELYKLPDPDAVAAMVGTHSLVPNWTAANLEASMYVKLMGYKRQEITTEMVQQAYGYNSLAKNYADTPLVLKSEGRGWVGTLPYGLHGDATIYEYDSEGKMLGRYRKTRGTEVYAQDPQARMIEGLIGFGDLDHSVIYGTDEFEIPALGNCRFYRSFLINGESNGQWQDITDSGLFTVTNGVFRWNVAQPDAVVCAKSDYRHYAIDLNLKHVGDLLYVDLVERANWFGETRLQLVPIPGGDIDVFLEKMSLIKGLDYKVEWPRIYINNRKWLKYVSDEQGHSVHVRMSGFCDTDMKFRTPEDFGFIEHGMLSHNHRFDIRDDKVLRIVVGGGTKDRKDLKFSEDSWQADILNVDNGTPYQVKDVVVPLSGLEGGETTYSLLAKSKIVDKAVSDYMTHRYPMVQREDFLAIPAKYQLVSPFFSRVIWKLKSNHFDNEELNQAITSQQISDLLSSELIYLNLDPLRDENSWDDRYVEVLPHAYDRPVSLNIYQYRFLDRVKRYFGNDRIDIQSHVTINNS